MSWKEAKIKLTRRTCEVCGNEFLSRAYNNTRCSDKCRAKDNYKKLTKRRNEVKTCIECGNEFYSDRSDRLYCSLECNYKAKKKVTICLFCGESFIQKKSENKRFCSRECFFKSSSNKETYLEVELYNTLNEYGLDFEKQKQIDRCIPDAFVSNFNLCIFADGKYWHNKPDVIKRDKRITRRLRYLGYTVIRLPEDSKRHLDLRKLVRFMEKGVVVV